MLHKTNMVPKYLGNLHALNLKYAQTQFDCYAEKEMGMELLSY